MDPNFSFLPRDLLYKVCAYLEDKKDIVTIGELDKNSNRLIFSNEKSSLVWKRFYPELEYLENSKNENIGILIKKIKTRNENLLKIAEEYQKEERKKIDYERLDFLGKVLLKGSSVVEGGLNFFEGGSPLQKLISSNKKYFSEDEIKDMKRIDEIFSKEAHIQPFISINTWRNPELLDIYKKRPSLLHIPVFGYNLTLPVLLCCSAAWFDSKNQNIDEFFQVMLNFLEIGAVFDTKMFSNFKLEGLSENFFIPLLENLSHYQSND